MRNYFNRGYDVAALLDFRGETPIIRRHLNQFYSALFFVSMSSALGSYLCFTGIFGRLFAALLAYLMFRDFRHASPSQQNTRVHQLVYCAFFVWGDLGFCSVECRERQIYLDETKEMEASTQRILSTFRQRGRDGGDRCETTKLLEEFRWRRHHFSSTRERVVFSYS